MLLRESCKMLSSVVASKKSFLLPIFGLVVPFGWPPTKRQTQSSGNTTTPATRAPSSHLFFRRGSSQLGGPAHTRGAGYSPRGSRDPVLRLCGAFSGFEQMTSPFQPGFPPVEVGCLKWIRSTRSPWHFVISRTWLCHSHPLPDSEAQLGNGREAGVPGPGGVQQGGAAQGPPPEPPISPGSRSAGTRAPRPGLGSLPPRPPLRPIRVRVLPRGLPPLRAMSGVAPRGGPLPATPSSPRPHSPATTRTRLQEGHCAAGGGSPSRGPPCPALPAPPGLAGSPGRAAHSPAGPGAPASGRCLPRARARAGLPAAAPSPDGHRTAPRRADSAGAAGRSLLLLSLIFPVCKMGR